MTGVPDVEIGSGVMAAKAKLLTDILSAFEKHRHLYCLMHGYTDYPNNIPSDVDLISSDPTEIPRILYFSGVASVVQVLEHHDGTQFI